MKKKIMLFLLAVFLGFALLISAICFFVPKKNQNSRENPTEQQKTEDTAEQTEKEKALLKNKTILSGLASNFKRGKAVFERDIL